MLHVKEIMKILKCDEARAFKVFHQMGRNGVDFSECTRSEFKRECLAAAKEV